MPDLRAAKLTVDTHIVGTDPDPASSALQRVGGRALIQGDALGIAAFGGEFYNHVMLAIGFTVSGVGGNPLTYVHAVGVYAALKGTAFQTGPDSYVIGFETALGQQAGAGTLKYAVSYSIGQFFTGAGSSVERVIGLMPYAAESGGTIGNAAIIDYSDSLAFTGDWWMYYTGTRPSRLDGDLLIGHEISRPVDNDYLRITGGLRATGVPNIILGADGWVAGSKRTISITTSSPSSPTGDDGTISFATQSGTARMKRDATWTFPAAITAASLQTAAPTGGAGVWLLGVANAVSPTSPNRTLTINVGGNTYYLAAKTTND